MAVADGIGAVGLGAPVPTRLAARARPWAQPVAADSATATRSLTGHLAIDTERPSVMPGHSCKRACMGMRVRVAGCGRRNGARPV